MYDDYYYSLLRKDLRKIAGRLELGLEDRNDLTIAGGILNIYLDSDNPEILLEVKKYIERFPVFTKILNGKLVKLQGII